ncbi:MAG: RNA-binding S4 domain-containing protein [Breznakibacter sp.]|nr:RNA-binding S4 domain-containing protein [Breznakibacter sp.]
MSLKESVRIDKFLWSVRLFKTRSFAAEACKKGRVTMGGMPVKTSRVVKVGDVLEIRVPPIIRSFKVLELADNRMGAKLVPGFIEDVTPADVLAVLEMSQLAQASGRPRGTGRPTKKERRDLDDFFIGDFSDEDID